MSQVYDEFVRELTVWQARYKDQPQREMLHLLFLSLEREEVVSTNYRETSMVQRLKTMPIAPEVQDLIQHALVWAWKDEQMHTIYLRGAILRLGNPALRMRAFAKQAIGFLGGWAGSVRQHVTWSQAPLSHSLATLITGFGSLTGQVPTEVRDHLRYRPFRDFCLFNIDAERTAALCYQRMLALLPNLPEAPAALRDDLQRVWEDEERHTRIFQIIAGALDEQDRLRPEQSAASLAADIASVGEHFLPRSYRNHGPGAAADIPKIPVWVQQGQSAGEKFAAFEQLLAHAGLSNRLQQRARALGKTVSELHIAIKPTFMLGYHLKDRSVLTDVSLIDALAKTLHQHGCESVAVVESRNHYDHFYANRSVRQVADYFGIVSTAFHVVDLSEEQVPHTYARGLAQNTVGRTWQDADFRIAFGKMRSHPVDQVYLSVGAMDGLGTRVDEFLFVERQAQRDTAIMMVLSDFAPDFVLLDAYDTAADGLLGVIGCPRPPSPQRLYASGDAVALDLVAARHMGLPDARMSSMLNIACQWFGDPTPHIQVIGSDQPMQRWRGPYTNEWTTLLSLLAFPVYQFASGRGKLFVPEMDTSAFPPLNREGVGVRIARRALQWLLGVRH
jgi:uncharacterized protein (DUF362 family)